MSIDHSDAVIDQGEERLAGVLNSHLKEALTLAAAAIDAERSYLDELTSIAGRGAIAVQLDGLRWELERAIVALARREREATAQVPPSPVITPGRVRI